MTEAGQRLKILIVDDSEMNRALLTYMLESKYEIVEAENGVQAVDILRERAGEFSLLLLDILMPLMDGFEVLDCMKRYHWIDNIPVIIISSETAPSYMERAYDLGAADYIARPFNMTIVQRRAANTIMLYAKQRQLMGVITQQLYENEKNGRLMFSILSNLVEFRNGESGLHVLHINMITNMLLQQLILKTDRYSLTQKDIALISTASALHDIGKMAIPSNILNKPGKFTPDEFEIMQNHAAAGADILKKLPFDPNEPLLKTAYEICRWHHERYDGKGYPDGLRGDDIPISAQVVALADVYDALTSERCYKKAYPHDIAMKMIFSGQCGAFAPILLECLRDIGDALEHELKTKKNWAEYNSSEIGHIAEQLHSYGLTSSEHVLRQQEYEQERFRFMFNRSEEIFFSYTASPPVLNLNEYGAFRLGVENVTVNPLENGALLDAIGADTMNVFTEKTNAATHAQPDFQTDVRLKVKNESHWFRCIAHTIWMDGNSDHCTGVIGKLIDVDGEYVKGEKNKKTVDKSAVEFFINGGYKSQKNGYCSMSGKEARWLIKYLQTVFDVVRLVDVEESCQVVIDEDGAHRKSPYRCYDMWNRSERCSNCIAAKCVSSKSDMTKFEFVDSNVYHIRSVYVEIDDLPYSLEMIDKITDDTLFGGMGREDIVKYISDHNQKLYIDSLTGVYNRLYYNEQLHDLQSVRAVAVMDVNKFKSINDTYGHLAGDHALTAVASAIKHCVRKSDAVARYGGDEFVIVFRDIPFEVFQEKLKLIQYRVAEAAIPDFPELRFSVSIGGIYGPGKTSELISMADDLMYRAKKYNHGLLITKLNEA